MSESNKNQKINNYAFIDSQNLNFAVKTLGWKIDYFRFRRYLKDKYNVTKAYMFIGFVFGNQSLYQFLQEVGFILVFKPTLTLKDGQIKGNCDAELVLHAMIEYINYDQAVIVTGDGDFHCLIEYLRQQDKFRQLIAPSQDSCSYLLRVIAGGKISFINDFKHKIVYMKNTS